MSCQCGKKTEEDPHAKVIAVLERIDFGEIADQAETVSRITASAVRHLQKAERAEALGYGGEVAAVHRAAADRENAQAKRLIESVIARVDERTSRDDWARLNEETGREFRERDGQALLEDAKARIRYAAYELEGLPAADATEAVALFDESYDRTSQAGLDGVTQLLRERLQRALAVRESPDLGREPSSPLTTNQWVCLGVVAALTALAVIACLATPFCWCCYGWWIAAAAAASIAACLLGVS